MRAGRGSGGARRRKPSWPEHRATFRYRRPPSGGLLLCGIAARWRLAACDRKSVIGNQKMVACNRKSVIRNRKMLVCNRKSVVRKRKTVVHNRKSVVGNRKMVERNQKSLVVNRNLVVRSRKPVVCNRKWVADSRIQPATAWVERHGGLKPALRESRGRLTLHNPPPTIPNVRRNRSVDGAGIRGAAFLRRLWRFSQCRQYRHPM